MGKLLEGRKNPDDLIWVSITVLSIVPSTKQWDKFRMSSKGEIIKLLKS